MFRPHIRIKIALSLTLSLMTVSAHSDEVKETVITLESAQEACALVSSPGDAVLIHTLDTSGAGTEDFSSGVVGWTRAKQILSLNSPTINYRHAEVLTEINLPDDLISWSFYPLFIRKNSESGKKEPFERHDRNSNFYRANFEVYRLAFSWDGMGTYYGQVANREWALQKIAKKEGYPGLGTCADFVNWAYDLAISSWWNFVPIAKQIIQLIYPPEAFRAPDDIARSVNTRKLCEVRANRLVYPESFRASKLWEQVEAALQSEDTKISGHAKQVRDVLIQNQVIDGHGNLLTDRVRFEVKKFTIENPFGDETPSQIGRQETATPAGQILPIHSDPILADPLQ